MPEARRQPRRAWLALAFLALLFAVPLALPVPALAAQNATIEGLETGMDNTSAQADVSRTAPMSDLSMRYFGTRCLLSATVVNVTASQVTVKVSADYQVRHDDTTQDLVEVNGFRSIGWIGFCYAKSQVSYDDLSFNGSDGVLGLERGPFVGVRTYDDAPSSGEDARGNWTTPYRDFISDKFSAGPQTLSFDRGTEDAWVTIVGSIESQAELVTDSGATSYLDYWGTTSEAESNPAYSYAVGPAIYIEIPAADKHTVTLFSDYKSGNKELGSFTKYAGNAAYIPSPTTTPTGYNYGDQVTWYDNSSCTGKAVASGTGPLEDDNVTALYARTYPNSYNIRYDANGGNGDIPNGTAACGSSWTVTNQTPMAPTGKKFSGWNSSSDGSGTWYSAGPKYTMPASDVTLYAIYTPESYKVEVQDYNEDRSHSDFSVTYGSGDCDYLLPDARTGYTYGGIFSVVSGEQAWAADGRACARSTWWSDYSKWRADPGSETDDVSFYFTTKWTPVTYDISYAYDDASDGGAQLASAQQSLVTSYNIETDTFTIASLSRAHYHFDGWTCDELGIKTPTVDPQVETGTTGALHFRAHWSRGRYTIRYHDNADFAGATVKGTVEDQSPVLETQSYKLRENGYEAVRDSDGKKLSFTGWNTKADGSGDSYVAGQWVSLGDDLDLYAQWTDKAVVTNVYEPTGAVRVVKRAKGTAEGLQGAEFTIVRSGDQDDGQADAFEWRARAEATAGGTSWPASEVEAAARALDDMTVADGTIASGADGVAQTPEHFLDEGWYAVLETKAPSGYTLSGQVTVFQVTGDGTVTTGYVWHDGYDPSLADPSEAAMVFQDDQSDGSYSGIRVRKGSSDGRSWLPGAVFEVYSENEVDSLLDSWRAHRDDVDPDGNRLYADSTAYVDSNATVVSTLSASDGSGWSCSGKRGFPLSTEYYVVEAQAPIGYKLKAHDWSKKDSGYADSGVQRVRSGAVDGTFTSDEVRFDDEPKTGTAVVTATKSLPGAPLSEGEFTFDLSRDPAFGTVMGQAVNDGLGKVTFDVPYDSTWTGETDELYVRENAADGKVAGIVYSDRVAKYTVKVSDPRAGDELVCETAFAGWCDSTGKLTQAAESAEEEPSFLNTPKTGSVGLRAQKSLETPGGKDRRIASGQFAFTVEEDADGDTGTEGDREVVVTSDGTSLQGVACDSRGKVAFADIDYGYDDIGAHTYIISEDAGGNAAIAYCPTAVTATVTVSENADDERDPALQVSVSYSGNGSDERGPALFGNTYASSGTATLQAKKSGVTGGSMLAGEYGVALYHDGERIDVKDVGADGWVTFDELSFDQEDVDSPGVDAGGNPVFGSGSELYQVREVVPDDAIAEVAWKDAADEVRQSHGFHDKKTGESWEPGDAGVPDGAVCELAWADATALQRSELSFVKDGVAYDGHAENVTVRLVDDGGGHIATAVSYDQDGPYYVNERVSASMPFAGGSGLWAALGALGAALALAGALAARARRKEGGR